ncbi:unnamed protein product [Closterium sp. Yama58-4]|nr:unnamed protein product [Closterium sp. Yama58-4]
MPEETISDHDFAAKVGLRLFLKAKSGPGLWKLPPDMINKPGVKKIIDATVKRTRVTDGSSFELLTSRLNAGLRSYAREEGKRIRATTSHLAAAVAKLKQEAMADPHGFAHGELLESKVKQLKEYHASRRERMHICAGTKEEMVGEIASKHLSGKIQGRKAKTQIAELKINGSTISDTKGILHAAADFFSGIFGEDRRRCTRKWSPAPGRTLSREAAKELEADWTEEEVKMAFQAMAARKSPGSDGLPKELFEANWDTLGGSLMALAEDFASIASLPAETKEAVTILLHKKGDRDSLNNYRPITLLKSSYKVLARVVANRIKRVLHQVISPEQYGFIPGRRLSDAVALVADVIDAAKHGSEDWYLLLVDFQKAFDSVSRIFIFMVLRNMGFPERFVAWVEGLHAGTTTKLLINGWLSEGIQVRSGVRQGCPLAPYLFLCAVEPLAQLVEKRKLGLSLAGQRLAYLGYADDTTLILQGKNQIKKAVRALAKFEEESGLATNKGKSVVMPLGVNLTSHPIASDGFKWAAADEAERLLGVWITPNGSCRPTWEKVLEAAEVA